MGLMEDKYNFPSSIHYYNIQLLYTNIAMNIVIRLYALITIHCFSFGNDRDARDPAGNCWIICCVS